MTQNQQLKEESKTLQASEEQRQAASQQVKPVYLPWPTSRRGPMSTPLPPGTKPINALRREQVVEIGYNQETGKPAVFTEASGRGETAQEALMRRKHRL